MKAVRRLVVLAAGIAALAAAPHAFAAQPYPLNFKTFDLSGGTRAGLTYSGGALRLGTPIDTFNYTDPFANYSGDGANGSGEYAYGTWTSAPTLLDFQFNELVASWNAQTPPGTWIQVEVSPQMDDGHWAKWYILGRWAYGDTDTHWAPGDADFHRTSVGGQGDKDGYVAIDTFFAKDHPAIAYQLRLTLYRRTTTTATPSVTRLSAIASNLRNQKNTFPSAKMNSQAVDLGVTSFSQEIHHGDYPQFDNGGEAWCSPTSTAMVVDTWGYSPDPSNYQYVYDDPLYGPNHPDAVVDFTAKQVYDYHYNGAGNWPFNTAYAAAQGLVADVTMLHNLREAETFIKTYEVPLVASVAWSSNKLDNAIKSTNGHLLVIGGFTEDGNVIAYDPAHDTDAQVRQIYDREQFERAWIPASGGIVYVDRPAGTLPETTLTANNS